MNYDDYRHTYCIIGTKWFIHLPFLKRVSSFFWVFFFLYFEEHKRNDEVAFFQTGMPNMPWENTITFISHIELRTRIYVCGGGTRGRQFSIINHRGADWVGSMTPITPALETFWVHLVFPAVGGLLFYVSNHVITQHISSKRWLQIWAGGSFQDTRLLQGRE